MEERLQKILASAGYGSRRSCEELITRRTGDRQWSKVQLGSKADPQKDQIKLDGKLIKLPEAFQYIALYKPRGVLSSVTSPDPRPTVRSLVPVEGTLYPVGRLDVDSEGLILLTNDGTLANQLTHPRYGHEKEYRVFWRVIPMKNSSWLGVTVWFWKMATRALPSRSKLNPIQAKAPGCASL